MTGTWRSCLVRARHTPMPHDTQHYGSDHPDLLRNFGDRSREAVFDGCIKLKLVHGRGTTVLLPELLIVNDDGWRWFRPQFFSPCLLAFIEDAASPISTGFAPIPISRASRWRQTASCICGLRTAPLVKTSSR